MNIGNYLKKRVNLFVGSLIFIAIAVLVTFIILTKNNYNKEVVVNNKNIRVTFENGKNGIMFGEYPMTLEEGLNKSPNNIYTIVNKSNSKVSYEVIVSDEMRDNSLDKSKVGVCVNDRCSSLSEFDDGIVYTSKILAKKEDTLNLKFFVLKDKYTNSDLDKSILLSVDIKEK